jgi:hypothetical protein
MEEVIAYEKERKEWAPRVLDGDRELDKLSRLLT